MSVFANPEAKKEPKKMLQLSKDPSGKHFCEINFSSLDLIQTCLRKSYYMLDQQLRKEDEAAALSFGTAIHKALEFWYELPQDQRELPSKYKEAAELIGFGHLIPEAESVGALGAIKRFYDSARVGLANIDSSDKRSISNGIKILTAYFKHYANDGLEVYRDKDGPAIERRVSFTIFDSPGLKIDYFGTIDLILQNKETGIVMVADHKTTHALGTEFYQRCKPNWQYCGYVLAAQKVLGLSTNQFMVNGIQVAKTKQEFARQVVSFDESDFADFKLALVTRVKQYIYAKENNEWPMTAPGPCSNYGGCQFLKVCEVPDSIKQNVINANWTSQIAKP